MAQQTINVGTAPNDGTGTPLRTAFQYTNSNFSELYTAVGPSGNNIVVPGSATITGDLTVQGVGGISIGSASFTSGRALAATSPAGSAVGIRLLQSATSDWEITNVATAGNLSITQSGANLLSLTGAGVFTFGDGAGGTRMTLNSTGLGVGTSPASLLHISGLSPLLNIQSNSSATATTASLVFTMSTLNTAKGAEIIAERTGASAASALRFHTNDTGGISTERMRIDSSGNVGIGVNTPTYKLDTQVAGGADRNILRAAVTGVSGGFNVNWNHATLKTHVIIENIPTSSAGLPAGTLWNDAGTIKIA